MSQVSKHIQLTQDNVEWFYKTYGESASLGWLLDMLLTQYVREIGEKTPAHYAALAAAELREVIHDG